jgi:hypothetical protein
MTCCILRELSRDAAIKLVVGRNIMGRSRHRHHSSGHPNGHSNGQGHQGNAPPSNGAPLAESHPVNRADAESADANAFDESTDPTNTATAVTPDAHAVSEQLEFLTSELDDRDQLVQALTSQLEEAVEQLDRLHRQGVDRSSRSAGGGGAMPADFIDEQRANSDRINQWLDQWDQSQPLDLWARIEDRIGELAAHLGAHGASPGIGSPAHAAPAAHQHHEPSAEQTPSASSWEETKQRLLGEMSFGLGDATPAAAAAPPATMAAIDGPPISSADVEFPTAIDLENSSREELCAAIETRDKYISYLTHRLRASEMQQPVNWDALSQAPADLRQQLVDLEGRYREHLRREECDLALERARLAREQARLQQDRTRLEHQMRRAGITADDNRPGGNPADVDERSWLKMFGRKR